MSLGGPRGDSRGTGPRKATPDALTRPGATEEDSHGPEDDSSHFEDEEEEKEPILKYKRLTGVFQHITRQEEITAMAVHEKFIVVGTAEGMLHRMPRTGDGIVSVKAHSMRVTAISVNDSGNTVATCSDDGTVNVVLLTGRERSQFKFHTPLRAVCLAPDYSDSGEKVFATGGLNGKLVLNYRRWMGSTDKVIHAGEGPIQAIAWKGDLLAWASDSGVKVYDVAQKSRVTFLPIPEDCPGIDVCRCHLVWESETSLLIGWADTIQVLTIKHRDPAVAASAGLPVTYAELTAVFPTTFIVCGLCPYNRDMIIALGYVMAAQDDAAVDAYVDAMRQSTAQAPAADAPQRPPIAESPELHALLRSNGAEVVADGLPVQGFEFHHALDYKLCALPGPAADGQRATGPGMSDADGEEIATDPLAALRAPEAFMEAYIVSPKDVVLSRPRSAADSARWAFERGTFQTALGLLERAEAELAAEESGAREDATAADALVARRERLVDLRRDLAEEYISDLLASGQARRAAAQFEKLVGPIPGSWDRWVRLFLAANVGSALVSKYPHTHPSHASVALGTEFLAAVARESPTALNTALNEWRPAQIPSRNDSPTQATNDSAEQEGAFDPIALQQAVADETRAAADRLSQSLLREAQAKLLRMCERHDEAFSVLLRCARESPVSPGVSAALLEAVAVPGMEGQALEHAVTLVRMDTSAATRMFARDTTRFPIRDVVAQLNEQPALLHVYLDQLSRELRSGYNDQSFADLHNRQLALYAEHAPQDLAGFLKRSMAFSEVEALRICNKHPKLMVKERVRLYAKLGVQGRASALRILVEDVGSAKRAIRFINNAPNDSLWERLFDFAMENPAFLGKLLARVGDTELQPWSVIERIPPNLEIPKLRQRLITMFDGQRHRRLLQESSTAVLRSDTWEEIRKHVQFRKRGVLVRYARSFVDILQQAKLERKRPEDGDEWMASRIHIRLRTGTIDEAVNAEAKM